MALEPGEQALVGQAPDDQAVVEPGGGHGDAAVCGDGHALDRPAMTQERRAAGQTVPPRRDGHEQEGEAGSARRAPTPRPSGRGAGGSFRGHPHHALVLHLLDPEVVVGAGPVQVDIAEPIASNAPSMPTEPM